MLEDTLVVAMGEFGRSPWINQARGRDHYPNAWSLAMAGGGVQGGALVGATDKYGAEVTEDPFNEENLFATIFSALGSIPIRSSTSPASRLSITSKTKPHPFPKSSHEPSDP